MNCQNKMIYTVQAGDSLYRLAKTYHTTVTELILGNPRVNPYNLQVGMQLNICPGEVPEAPEAAHRAMSWVEVSGREPEEREEPSGAMGAGPGNAMQPSPDAVTEGGPEEAGRPEDDGAQPDAPASADLSRRVTPDPSLERMESEPAEASETVRDSGQEVPAWFSPSRQETSSGTRWTDAGSPGQPERPDASMSGQVNRSEPSAPGQPGRSDSSASGQANRSDASASGQPERVEPSASGQMNRPEPSGQESLSEEMVIAWLDHVYWLHILLLCVSMNADESRTAEEMLLQTADEITDAFAKFLPATSIRQLRNMLNDHVELAGEVIDALRAGRKENYDSLIREWYANLNKLAVLLGEQKPYTDSVRRIRNMLLNHLDLTREEIEFQIRGDCQKSVEAFWKVHDQALAMAAWFAAGAGGEG